MGRGASPVSDIFGGFLLAAALFFVLNHADAVNAFLLRLIS